MFSHTNSHGLNLYKARAGGGGSIAINGLNRKGLLQIVELLIALQSWKLTSSEDF